MQSTNVCSDSSSEDDETTASIFQSVCDPTFAKSYSSSRHSKASWQPIEQVTGDSQVDKDIHELKTNIAYNDCIRLASKSVPAGTAVAARSDLFAATHAANTYMMRRMEEVLSSRVSVRKLGNQHKALLSPNNDSCDDTYDSEDASNDTSSHQSGNTLDTSDGEGRSCRLQLLPKLWLDPSMAEHKQATTDEGLKRLRRRYGYYCAADDECSLQERCCEVALPLGLIHGGRLESLYAEHRNTNPKKVEYVRLLKSKKGVLFVGPRLPAGRGTAAGAADEAVEPQRSNASEGAVTADACSEQLIEGTAEKLQDAAIEKVQEAAEKVQEATTEKVQEATTEKVQEAATEQTVKRKKTKSRKRGIKKKKSTAVISEDQPM